MSSFKEQILTLVKQRHHSHKVALEQEKDPRSKHAIDLIARIREDSRLIEVIDSLPEEKLSYVTDSPGDPGNPGEPGISDDLKEAAEKYIQGTLCDLDDGPTVGLAKGGFIAGAEWQRVQDEPYMKRNNLELSFMLENARKGGILEGKAEMMKEAVEGEVENSCFGIVYLRKNLMNEGYSTGDKVKIIIVKK